MPSCSRLHDIALRRFVVNLLSRLDRIINGFTATMDLIARGAIMVIMVVTCVNIVARAFGRPITGAYEVGSVLMAITLALSLPFSMVKKIHVSLELMVSRLSGRSQALFDTFTGVLSFCLFLCMAWQCWMYASKLARVHSMYATLRMPIYPFVYVLFFGLAVACLVLLFNLIKSASEVRGRWSH